MSDEQSRKVKFATAPGSNPGNTRRQLLVRAAAALAALFLLKPGRATAGVLAPGAGDTVSSPFIAYGALDPGATSASVKVTSDSTGQSYDGVWTNPPAGADWAYTFNVPPGDYTLTDTEAGGGTYIIDPIHVI